MILVQLILNKIQSHLSQCRLGVRLNLCVLGALFPIRHSSNDIFQKTRKFWFKLIGFATGLSMLTFLACLAGHSRRHGCFQFLASILKWFFLIPCPQGQLNKIPRNLLASSSFGFSLEHLCISFISAFLPNLIQSSGHK